MQVSTAHDASLVLTHQHDLMVEEYQHPISCQHGPSLAALPPPPLLFRVFFPLPLQEATLSCKLYINTHSEGRQKGRES